MILVVKMMMIAMMTIMVIMMMSMMTDDVDVHLGGRSELIVEG